MIEDFLPYIDNLLKPYIILDIGSRDGEQSVEFYHKFPNAHILAFECNPNTLSLCEKNIANFKDRITLIPGAVSDYDGRITFYPINQQQTRTTWVDGNPGASSLFKSNGTYPVEHYVQDEIETACHRLDTILKSIITSDSEIIIWMDLQGAELLALKGLGLLINQVHYIYTEISHKPIYEGQVLFPELHSFLTANGFDLKNRLGMSGWQEDAIYAKTSQLFDIVIPLGPNDVEVITKQLDHTKKNVIGYRKIFVISSIPGLQLEGCVVVPEELFPFNLSTVAQFHGSRERNGWYLQQLLKLYAGMYIDGILNKYLVIDADTFFLQPTSFLTITGEPMYSFSTEYHIPYFIHMKKLHPAFDKVIQQSGICHHMFFETVYIKELISQVENIYQKSFIDVFLSSVTEVDGSGASEYEIYFNYMIKNHKDHIVLRQLTSNDVVSYHYYGSERKNRV
jgi:FkbM family methyltransferase